MFDPFKQAKLQNGYQAMKQYKPAPEKDMSLDDLKRLSGVDKVSKQAAIDNQANKAEYMRENNIKPGTKEWFKLWFAQPHITGEDPFSKK